MSQSQVNPLFVEKEDEVVESHHVDDDERNILADSFPKNYTYAIFAGVIINTAMLLYSHFGLSAVIKSAVCPEGFKGCPEAVDIDNLKDECINENDAAILVPGNPALDEVPLYMSEIGVDCLGQGQCIVDSVMELHGLTIGCANCFALSSSCAVEECFFPCLANPLSLNCLRCNNANCQEAFENCTGVEFPSNLNFSQSEPPGGDDDGEPPVVFVEGEECFDRDQFELFKVFNLTFINSIEEAIVGGSIPLALLILIASGFWPYTKNALMIYAWTTPLTQERRNTIFRVLAVLGKWSLVDVFAVVVIINAVVIQKILSGDSPLIVFAESRPGIYMFGIAALWALSQGEIMRVLDKRRQRELYGEPSYTNPEADIAWSLKRWKIVTAVFASVAFWFALLGLFALNLSFNLEGRITEFVGINAFGYSAIGMASGLVDECAIFDGHESVAGARFLSFLFVVLIAVIPLLSYVLLFLTGIFFKPERSEGWLVQITFGLSNFAALDVFFLSVITLASQFEGLIEAAVGDGVDEQCGVTAAAISQGEFCIKFLGEIENGSWFVLLSALSFWVSLYASGRLMRETEKLKEFENKKE